MEGFVDIYKMLDSMDRDDVINVWRLYKERFGSTPSEKFAATQMENTYEKIMYSRLKLMLKPHVTDREWVEMRHNRVNRWFIYQSCGVHVLSVGVATVFLLTDKDYRGLNANKGI